MNQYNKIEIFMKNWLEITLPVLIADQYHLNLQSQPYSIYIQLQFLMMQSQKAYLAAVSAMEKLLAKAKDSKSTSHKSCIVALYTADDDNPLRFSGKIGMLQIDIDRDFKLHFLRFYDIQSLQLLFEVELFYSFGDNYRKTQKDTLYIFDLFADGIVGFQFRTKQQAEIFAMKVKSVSPKNQEFRQLMKDRIQKQISAKKQSSFFGKIKKKLNNLVHEEQHHEESIVLKVQKKKSITLNQTGQFDLDNAPPEWQDFLARAGVKKQDLKDKQLLKLVIQQTIVHQAKKEAQQNPDLDKKHFDLIKEQQEEEDQVTDCTSNPSTLENLPPPPQIDFLDLPPPPPSLNLPPGPTFKLPPPPSITLPPIDKLTPVPDMRANRASTNRADLMAQIRNNNLKLKPVKVTEKGMELDLSSMNKQQRHDLAQHLRLKLQRRKQALNRRKASDDEDEDS